MFIPNYLLVELWVISVFHCAYVLATIIILQTSPSICAHGIISDREVSLLFYHEWDDHFDGCVENSHNINIFSFMNYHKLVQ